MVFKDELKKKQNKTKLLSNYVVQLRHLYVNLCIVLINNIKLSVRVILNYNVYSLTILLGD